MNKDAKAVNFKSRSSSRHDRNIDIWVCFVYVYKNVQNHNTPIHRAAYEHVHCSCCLGEEIQLLYAYCTQYQMHYANDADELERFGFFEKSKTNVAKLNALNP